MPVARSQSSGQLGALSSPDLFCLNSSPVLGVRLMTALQVLQVHRGRDSGDARDRQGAADGFFRSRRPHHRSRPVTQLQRKKIAMPRARFVDQGEPARPPGRGGDITQRRRPRPGSRTRDRHPRSQRDQTGKARRRRSRGRRSIRGEGGLRSRRLTVGKRTGGRTGRRGEPLRMGGGEIGRRGPEWRCRVRVYVMPVSGVY